MYLVTNRNSAILLTPERWGESQFLEDKVHMMTQSCVHGRIFTKSFDVS